MTRACYFFMWIFLAGTVLFAILTACCDCMSPGHADQAPEKPSKGGTPAGEQTEDTWHADVTPTHAPEPQPDFSRHAPSSHAAGPARDPNAPDWYQEAVSDRNAMRANTSI